MRTTSLKLPDDLDAKLKAAAGPGRSKSTIMREALESYLGKSPRRRSFLDQARDLAGSVVGPADLSTNRARLGGYGR